MFCCTNGKKGYSGTELVFEGKEGFMSCFGEGWAMEKLIGDLGVKHKILECSMKAFPTEALTHTYHCCFEGNDQK
ncbi:MAG: MmgE/PrpD family protein [Ignavibacteriales bacterium]|nr:MmgE/PrpD family protein [Ignavibacteriales bacterium]